MSPSPTYTGVTVKEDDDTRVLILACERGGLPRVKARIPKDQTEHLMRDGYVFVFEETESKMKRWTDVGKWTVHNKRGNFTTSREESRRLIKHSFNTEQDGKRIHIIAYSSFETQLPPASHDARLRHMAFKETAEYVPKSPMFDGTKISSPHEGAYPIQESTLPVIMSDGSIMSLHPHSHQTSTTSSSGIMHSHSRSHSSSGPVYSYPSSHGSIHNSQGVRFVPELIPPTHSGASQSDVTTDTVIEAPGTVTAPDRFTEFAAATTSSYIYPDVPDINTRFMARFLGHLNARHSTTVTCYAAVETFLFELSGSTMLLAILATLRVGRDTAVINERPFGANPVAEDLVIFPAIIYPPNGDGTGPLSWLQTQRYAEHFRAPRSKAAVWSLGHLPPMSHAHGSASFKWLKQELRPIWTDTGMQHVVVISSGDSRYPLPPLHQLKSQLSHEANLSFGPQLLDSLDEELVQANEECAEDWLLAVHDQMDGMAETEWHTKLALLTAYSEYMGQTITLDEQGFLSAGYNYCPRLLHLQTYPQMTFRQLCEAVQTDVNLVLQPLYAAIFNNQNHVAGIPNMALRQIARRIGHHFYFVRHSYAMLSADELTAYHAVTFDGLVTARSELLKQFPTALIWNYLPYEIAASMKRKRLNLTREGAASLVPNT